MLNNKLSLLVLPLLTTLSLQANDPFMQDPFGDDIFKEMMHMQQNMDKMFNRMHQRIQQRTTRLASPIGTYKISQPQAFVDKKDHYEYVTNIPENKENHIDINAKDGVMSITAKIIEKQENKTANSFSSSSSMRMYQQSIPLPTDSDAGSISAEYKDGKLVISVKKLKNVPKVQSNIRINGASVTPAKVEEKQTTEKNETKEQNNTKKKITINSDVPSMS
ncbi:MAG TPA: Hsp20/alpha crystallin family protein [Epsilonproteobacteria bacterium]|nr:Hsp20/alpha crystallin family protein [Campylobacterota bacterium]